MNTSRTTARLAIVCITALALPLAGCTNEPEPGTTATSPQTGTPSADGTTSEPTSVPTAPVRVVGPTQSPGEDVGPLPDAGPEDDAPFVANTDPDTSPLAPGTLMSPTDLRFGVHDGYDRLVLDLSGNGEPGWLAEYVAEPTSATSGLPVDVEGNAVIALSVQGMIYPTEEGAEPYEGPSRIVPTSTGAIRGVVVDSLFEGTLQIFVGVDSELPFRVYLLTNPTRLVVDVQHP